MAMAIALLDAIIVYLAIALFIKMVSVFLPVINNQ